MANAHKYAGTFTVPAPTAASDALATAGGLPVGLVISSTWTSANITFQVSPPESTSFHALYTSTGGAVTVSGVTADSFVQLDPAVFAGADRIKIKSASAQAAARSVQLVVLARDDKSRS